jgi:hypothetical protein
MSAYISVKNNSSTIISANGIHRLNFPHLVVSNNFCPPFRHIIGSSIPFGEEGVYRINIKLNITLLDVESFSVSASDQNGKIIDTSTITYDEKVDPNTLLKTFTVSSSFFHGFMMGDSIYFDLITFGLNSPNSTITIENSSNVNIFKL